MGILVAKRSLVAGLAASGVDRDSLNESWAAKDAALEILHLTVSAKTNFVELFKDRLQQQKTTFEKTKAVSEAHLGEAKAQLDARFTEMTAQRDRLSDRLDRCKIDWSVLRFELMTTRHQMGAARSEAGTIGGQLAEQKRPNRTDGRTV